MKNQTSVCSSNHLDFNRSPTKDIYIRPTYRHATTEDVYIHPQIKNITENLVVRNSSNKLSLVVEKGLALFYKDC